MGLIEKAKTLIGGRGHGREPVGAIRVVDPSPLNWLWITYNTVEELVRVLPNGLLVPAAMRRYRWMDPHTLEIRLRRGERFPDGEPLTAATVERSFREATRWASPHPPGMHFNIDPRTRCEVVDEGTVRFHLPERDGLALGKLRAIHIMSTRFWDEIGFGYARQGNGEGRW